MQLVAISILCILVLEPTAFAVNFQRNAAHSTLSPKDSTAARFAADDDSCRCPDNWQQVSHDHCVPGRTYRGSGFSTAPHVVVNTFGNGKPRPYRLAKEAGHSALLQTLFDDDFAITLNTSAVSTRERRSHGSLVASAGGAGLQGPILRSFQGVIIGGTPASLSLPVVIGDGQNVASLLFSYGELGPLPLDELESRTIQVKKTPQVPKQLTIRSGLMCLCLFRVARSAFG